MKDYVYLTNKRENKITLRDKLEWPFLIIMGVITIFIFVSRTNGLS